jgi:hypothetical protein
MRKFSLSGRPERVRPKFFASATEVASGGPEADIAARSAPQVRFQSLTAARHKCISPKSWDVPGQNLMIDLCTEMVYNDCTVEPDIWARQWHALRTLWHRQPG